MLLTAEEVAERLRCSRAHAYEVMRRIPFHVRVGRRILLPEEALDAWLERGGDKWQGSTGAKTAPIGGRAAKTKPASAGTKAPAPRTKRRRSKSPDAFTGTAFYKLPKGRGSR